MAITDERVKKDIVEQLFWDNRVDSTNIDVKVKDFVVTLNGTVDNYLARTSAFQDAWDVSGVEMVINNLEVTHEGKTNLPTDSELKNNIKQILEWDTYIDSVSVKISVKDGWVTFEGTQDEYWKVLRIEDLASGIEGIVGITNNLAVVPTHDIIDQAIANDITSALARNIGDDSDLVDVEVENGVVTLSGILPSKNLAQQAFQVALLTKGVTFVHNELKIEAPQYVKASV
ncbi:MAG: BON domain-containing protein [Vulcanimicrobiota bacterium]